MPLKDIPSAYNIARALSRGHRCIHNRGRLGVEKTYSRKIVVAACWTKVNRFVPQLLMCALKTATSGRVIFNAKRSD
jgi:hypothetical protein